MQPRWLGTIVVLGFFFAPAFAESDSPLIQSLQIAGTRRPLALETRAGEPLDEDRIDRDVRRLWTTGWFDDIRVESFQAAEGVQLVFTLVERPRLYLRRIVFEPARERQPLRKLRKGVPVDTILARQVAAELRRQLAEEGYADAKVEAELRPAGFRRADLHLRVKRGHLYRVREVRLSGPLGLKPNEAREALRFTRPRRVLPGLGPLWGGWRLLQPLGEQHLQADVERLWSLYFSRGYFDARVEISTTKIADGRATVTVEVDSGRRYSLRRLEVVGAGLRKEIPPKHKGVFSTKELCQCLLEVRRESEKRGEVNFSAQLQLKTTPAPPWAVPGVEAGGEKPRGQRSVANSWADITAKIKSGPAYQVGRIKFSGHHAVTDATLRRALLLLEGDRFDQERLRRSLVRLNQLSLLEPVAISDVRTELVPDDRRVNLNIQLNERPRGRWSLSGPPGPASALGVPQFTIGTRLPSLGQGPVELSTYYASFSLLAFPSPWASLLTSAPQIRWRPLLAVGRPYIPSQGWQSGFLLSPELGWQRTLASYGLTQGLQATRTVLGQELPPPLGMSVPAFWRAVETEGDRANIAPAGVLRCEERKPSWAWLRAAGPGAAEVAANWLLTTTLHH